MSGDGGSNWRKGVRKESENQQSNSSESSPTQTSHANPRTHGSQRCFVDESDPPGAVGGQYPRAPRRTLTEDEQRVGRQAEQLLTRFIMDQAQSEHINQDHRNMIYQNIHRDADNNGQTASSQDDYLGDVSLALRNIGDQLSEDYELNSLIDKVPMKSPKDIFMKVCQQMFEDGQFNWGRVVALFYFAYRLIVKAILKSTESIPWIKEIFSWAMDFFYQYLVLWIIQRGGWKMIQEYWGSSPKTLVGLASATILSILFVWWKQR